MTPTIHDGQIITILPVAFETINIGDIVLYKKFSNHLTIHRVVSFDRIQDRIAIKTKGDNNQTIDDYYVFPDEIIGKVLISFD